MKHKIFIQTLAVLILLVGTVSGQAQDLKPIALPPPQKTGGKPLLEALNSRKSTRTFTAQKLSQQMLSNLLWAAYGQNREVIVSESTISSGRPGRTAPSGMNLQEIDMYVALAEGVYVYESSTHRLLPVLAKDIRATVNLRPTAADAAVGLIYVDDLDKVTSMPAGFTQDAVDAGFIGQNVYLFCASEGLGTFFHATDDREGLAKTLNLRPAQRVLYCQTVGYAAESASD